MLFQIAMVIFIFGVAYAGYYVDEQGWAGE